MSPTRIIPTLMPIWQSRRDRPRHHWIRNVILFVVLVNVLSLVLTLTLALLLVWAFQVAWNRWHYRRGHPAGWWRIYTCRCSYRGDEILIAQHRRAVHKPILFLHHQMGAPGRQITRWMNR